MNAFIIILLVIFGITLGGIGAYFYCSSKLDKEVDDLKSERNAAVGALDGIRKAVRDRQAKQRAEQDAAGAPLPEDEPDKGEPIQTVEGDDVPSCDTFDVLQEVDDSSDQEERDPPLPRVRRAPSKTQD